MNANSAAFAGDIPHYYDECLGPMIFVDYATDLARDVASREPVHVLELACGTGIATRFLRDALPAASRLTATGLQPDMLEIARTKFRSDDDIALQAVDATDLPFADGAFDAVMCQFGVMFFPDRDRSYREVCRVLSSGGMYSFNVWDSHLHNAFARITNDLMVEHFANDPPPFMKLPFSYPFDPIKDSLIAAGFTDICASVVRRQKAVPDPLHFARGLIYGSPIADQIRTRGNIDPDRFVEKLAAAFRREFGDPARMTIQAIVFSATKP